MLARLFAVLLLAPALLLPVSAAAPDPTAPGVQKWVEGRLDLAQPDLARIELAGDLLLHKYPIGSRPYTAGAMARQHQGVTDFSEGAGEAFVASVEAAVRSGLASTLANAFPTATRTVTVVDADEASLAGDRVDEYDPPVRVRVEATIERSRADVGLGELTDDAVSAVFLAGGRVQSTFRLVADPGYDLTYVVHPPRAPQGVVFSQISEGVVDADGATVTLRLDNARGATPLARPATLHLLDPAASPPSEESIVTEVEVTLGALQRDAASLPVEARVSSLLHAVSVRDRFPGALPPSVELDVLGADALRALWQADAIREEDLRAADDALLGRLVADLGATLGADARASGGIDRADLARDAPAPFDDEPPVPFEATATGSYAVPGERAADADLALAIGGTLRIDLALGGGMTYRVHPPPGTRFVDPAGGTVTADGLTATFAVPAGAAPVEARVALRREGAPAYAQEDARLGILVDLRDVDVGVGQAMSGDFGTLMADVTVRGEMRVLAVPASVRGSLGGTLDLPFVSSDGVRLLLDRGLLPRETLDELEAALLAEVRANLAQALGTDVEVAGGLDAASLATALVSDPPTADAPIVFEARAAFARPLTPPTEAAIALYSLPQSFTFPRVRDLDTTYTVVLPRGLAITSLDASGGASETTEWPDGRQAFVVRPTGDAATTAVTMSVTPTFVLLKFWPLVLGALVALVLLVGTPIALVALKRRKA